VHDQRNAAVELLSTAMTGQDPTQMALASYLVRYRGTTFTNYRATLRDFCAWCAGKGVEPLAVIRAQLEVWVHEQEAEGHQPSTIHRKFTTIRGFYRLALEDDYITKDPTLRVILPKVWEEQQRRPYLTPLQFAAMLEAARKAGPKEHAIISLFGMSGLRIAELCSLNIEGMFVHAGHDVLSFIGKGKKPAEVPMPIPVSRAVRQYQDLDQPRRTRGPLFLNEHGHRITVDNATLIVKKMAKAAHIDPTTISPHGLRRTFCTSGLLSGVPIAEMQVAMRHSDPKTTSRYNMAKSNLDRHASHRVASYLAGMTDG
jgi:integrase/recombinase XerD